MKVENARSWYQENRQVYIDLCRELEGIIQLELNAKNVLYNNIASRAKDIDSFTNKCKKDKYCNPIIEISDVAGVRITAYTNSDVDSISKIIEDTFVIDYSNSVNKSAEIGVNEFGYLSVHYIAQLPDKFIRLTKYERYKDIRFEIQIRTLLQHAWSEIEHDRNYKFNGVLPKDLKRRFYMIAGVLEMVDREFEQLTKDIFQYSEEVANSMTKGNYDIELNSESVSQLLKNSFEGYNIEEICHNHVLEELKRYGIGSIKDLKGIIDTISRVNRFKIFHLNKGEVTADGILRDIMIINNSEKYFKTYNKTWSPTILDVTYFLEFGIDLKNYVSSSDFAY